ncbi:MAG: hypothetical protein WC838_03990 [Candidatus Margulisiibacteriota bacterium]|jgi:hypothetical protein
MSAYSSGMTAYLQAYRVQIKTVNEMFANTDDISAVAKGSARLSLQNVFLENLKSALQKQQDFMDGLQKMV